MATWRGPGGIEVEVIVLDRSPLYKVTQLVEDRRYFVAYAHDIPTLEQHVTLADLVEVIQFPA